MAESTPSLDSVDVIEPLITSTKGLSISTKTDRLGEIDSAFPSSVDESSQASSNYFTPSSSRSLDSLYFEAPGKEDADAQLPDDTDCPPPIQPLPCEPLPEVTEMTWDFEKQKSFCKVASLLAPIRRGCFSCQLKPDGEVIYSEEAFLKFMRYLNIPANNTVMVNLREGYSEGKLKPDEGVYLLKYIHNNHCSLLNALEEEDDDDDDDDDDNGARKKEPRKIADVITTSKILTMIMTTPYNKSRSWKLIAMNVRGSLLLLDNPVDLRQTKAEYENRKFTLGVTRTYNRSKADSNGLVYTVSQGIFGDHRILYSTEIRSAANPGQTAGFEPLDSMKFVHTQVRSYKSVADAKSKKTYWRNAGLNLWCETLLGKIETIVFGHKEPGGWVKLTERCKTQDIVKSSNTWHPENCTNFLEQILTFTRTSVNRPSLPFEILYEPITDSTGKIVIKPLDAQASQFVPSWYLL